MSSMSMPLLHWEALHIQAQQRGRIIPLNKLSILFLKKKQKKEKSFCSEKPKTQMQICAVCLRAAAHS